MSSDSTGPCVVCGIVIKHRCSSCAEHGFDFFLCGREHQKLVYFAHKRVCGVNANPFRFPPLTAAEAEEAILARDETQSWDRCTLTTVFEELMGIDPPQVPIVIANLQAGGAAHEPPVFSYYGTVNVRYYLSAIAYTRQYGGRRAVLQPTEDLAYVDNPMWMASCAA